MTTLEEPTTTLWRPADATPFDEAQLAAAAFLRVIAGERWTRTGTTFVPSSDGPPTTSCLSSTRQGRTSSCTAPRWKSVGLRPPRSTVDCRRCAASTGSLTSTGESRRTRPSTSVAPRSRPARVTAWTVPSWARSCSPPNGSTAITPRWPCFLVSMGCECQRRAEPTSRTWRCKRGHRTLRILGKGNKPATIPLVPRTARTIDLVIGERHEGPILRRKDGQRLDRRTAHRWVRSIGKRGRTRSRPSAHAPRRVHHGRPRRWRAAARCPDRRPPRRSENYHDLRPPHERTSTGTPPMSSWPSSPEADSSHSLSLDPRASSSSDAMNARERS